MDIPGEYLTRIRSAWPHLAIATAELNQEGLVNDVVIVNDELVVRFPKSERARHALAHEARVLDVVARHVSMSVPHFEYLSKDMAAYRLIRGEPLTQDTLHSLSMPDRDRVLEQLGGFLAQMHAIDPGALAGVGTSDAVRSREDWLEFADRIEEILFPLLMRYQRDWIASHFAGVRSGELDLSYEPALTHGDLAPYHIIFDPSASRIAGVIDFGTGGLGDPAVDIACLIYQYGESLVRQLAAHYPRLDACIDRARFWAGTLELQWALAGVLSDDRSLLVAHIGSARDVRPPGTSSA